MIWVSRFNTKEFVVNAELIEFIEETPDTVLTLVTGKKILVKESAAEIVEKVLAYRRSINPSASGVTALKVTAPED
ncbi:MAG: flagellar FlbD family protein [bacterium]